MITENYFGEEQQIYFLFNRGYPVVFEFKVKKKF
jgi:hypothetical protein